MVETPNSSGWWPDLLDPLRQAGERIAQYFSPRSDASADDDAYRISVELPGVKEADIDIQMYDGVVTVRGEKKTETEHEEGGYFFSERQYGRFQRTFRLPADAAEAGVEARVADGVLTLTVPRRTPQAKGARKIEVRSG